ncbi:hypothetical protein VTN31DRAFT_886 [Thermomyces dupontii]|uniref:uncharacterized protein n=1 Tax=Talaromyces thermophilus TaxID=28565 RepID=UPI00374487A6
MESPTHSLVDAAMKCLPHMLPVLDFSTVKNEVFPPIASTFSKTNSLAIKIRGLESFVVLCGGSPEQPLGEEALGPDGLTGVLGDDKRGSKPNATSILDKYTVQEKLVPLLKAIRTKEPAVMMAALKVFLRVGQIVDTEFLALQVLPILWTFALGPLLNLSQFEQYMGVIRSFSSKVEREHSRKLKELSARDDGGATTSRANDDSLLIASSSGVNGSASATSDFERLVLGRSSSTSTNRNGLDILDSNDNASRRPASIAATTTTTAAPRTTAPAITSPTFSWSSTSRSITPDSTGVMMNNFPSLEPSRPGTGTASNTSSQSQFPVLQPTTASTTTTTTTTSSSSSSSQPLSSLSSLRNSLPATSSTSSTPTPNYAAFSIPPPPSTSSANPPISGFGPMPTGANMGSLNAWSGQTQNQNQNQNQGQPQGLDKYASLL